MNSQSILKKLFSMVTFAALFNLSGCGESGYTSPNSTSPISASTVLEVSCSSVIPSGTVHIQANSFAPGSETIATGGIVKWENNDSVAHTVTGGIPGSPDENFDINLAPGQVRCLHFTTAGTYPYYCKIHPNMTAQIVTQ